MPVSGSATRSWTTSGTGAASPGPVRRSYELLLRRPVTDDEWLQIVEEFHAHYRARMPEATLRSAAREALTWVADSGMTQSLLSMGEHDDLVPLVAGT